MRIRHITSADNLDAEGWLLDPLFVVHGIVVGGQIADMSGLIDPLTHLNLDFPSHCLGACLVAERLERGAALRWDGDHFALTEARALAYTRLGAVDESARRAAMQRLIGGRN
ncbi:MAG: hypothetical protein WCK70_14755 [Chloroflexales bacterium]|jgi:hypothetical protein